MKGELAIILVWRLVCGGVGYRDKCDAGDSAKERRKIHVCTRGREHERAWEPQIGALSCRRKSDNDFLLLATPEGNRAEHLVGLRVVVEFCVSSPPYIVRMMEYTHGAFVTGGRELSHRKSTTRRRCYRFFFSTDTVVIC